MKQLILLDICTADYFRGHSLPVFTSVIYPGITVGKMIEGIEENFDPDLHEQYSKADFENAIAWLREKNKDVLELPFMLDTEEEEDDTEGGDCTYAYFILDQYKNLQK